MRQTYFSDQLMHFVTTCVAEAHGDVRRRPARSHYAGYVTRSGSRRMMTFPCRTDSVAFACRRTAS